MSWYLLAVATYASMIVAIRRFATDCVTSPRACVQLALADGWIAERAAEGMREIERFLAQGQRR